MTQSELIKKNSFNNIQNNFQRPSFIMINSAPSTNSILNFHQLNTKQNNTTNVTKTNIDLSALRKTLCMDASFLEDSGYSGSSSLRSFITSNCSENKSNNIKKPDLPLYGTGWMVAENLSDSDESLKDEQTITENDKSIASVFAASVFENLSNVINNKKVENKKRVSRDNDYWG